MLKQVESIIMSDATTRTFPKIKMLNSELLTQ